MGVRQVITGRLLASYRAVVSSYAFVPSLFVTAGVAISTGLTILDNIHGEDWIRDLPFVLGPGTPEGARGVLTTIGGSMLSVAGIVFSITLAAIVFASGQYGPHVLPQYRRDRFAQCTLGVMLGVFAYCVVTLYAVRGGEEMAVPRLAIFGALLAAAAGIIMLMLFIAHMLKMLHVSSVVARIGGLATHLMKSELPLRTADTPKGADVQDPVVDHGGDWLTDEGDPVLTAIGTGYVLTEGTEKLVGIAAKHDLRVDVMVRPGDYVTPLTPIFRVAPELPAQDVVDAMRAAIAYGRRRTPDEDVAFLLDELCAIGLRALSPGVNDPFTATDVIHQVTAVTERAARGRPLDAHRRDRAGEARVRRPVLTFSDVVRLGFDRLSSDVATNVTVTPILIRVYDELLSQRHDSPELERLRRSAERFESLCAEQLPTEVARAEAKRALSRVLRRSQVDAGPGRLRIDALQRELAR